MCIYIYYVYIYTIQLVLPMHTWVWGNPLEHSPSPNSQQLSTEPQLGVEALMSLPHPYSVGNGGSPE